ncbi:uncharacterized protein [Medicago truncatula]|uniref:uncharacterized protein n=1 Tax=Medicago truncatula TaxID=3880 RepID=UPI000D2F1746|nr:uncharacterized protein LOC11438061 [Medicago truncatula]
MASFLTDLAKPYVDKLINGVIAESSYICCFTYIAKDFEEERVSLEIEKTTVKQRVDVATSRGEDVQANALSWEEEADKLIQEDTRTKQKCFFGFCSHCVWRYRRGKELTNKKEQIKRLIETGKELSIGLPARLPGVERYSSQHYIPFKSRESKYKELLDALKDDNNYVIGLKGMGGTGKTTLAKEVGKELKQSKQFTQIIDTTVSFSPDIKNIQDDIAGPLGLKFDDCNESDRPKKLWSRLTNGEKILLILDDVWGDIDFNEIGIPYSDNHKGCRILVTTRNLLVCNRLGCSKTMQLDLLSEEDAWIMFKRHAGLSEISTKNLLEKGRKIANECKRLPIAIAAIASSLKGIQRPEEWEWALKSLQKNMQMHNVDDELVKIYKCLKFSYDNMKNEKAKRLFLLCSVFREDEKIPTERLTRLSIGGGLFGEDYVSYEDARSQVVISKNKLLDSCLLLEAKKSRVQMHDMVRDAAQWIASKEIQTMKLYDKNQKAMVEREKNIKYLLCEGKLEDVFSCMLDGSKLEILIVTGHKKEGFHCHDLKIDVPNSFFENSTGLRVFYLIYDKYSSLSLSLPHSIQSLKNIRSLLFANVILGDISILGNLQSLETLDLDGCKIDELPHGITKLEKLKLLNLTSCRIARNNPFEVIEGCSSLEELYFIGSFNDFCREITFPKLQRFDIGEFSNLVDKSSLKGVSDLVISDNVFLSETTLKYCMQEAEVLELGRIEGGWRNIVPEIVPLDHGMNDLIELGLRSISQLQCLIDTNSPVSKVFSKLVVLKLKGMDNLEELFNGPVSFDSLNSLEKLSINECKHLKSLFKCNLNLCNLKSLSLEECPMLISLFQLSTVVSLVLLEKLEIIDCERLENIIIVEKNGDELRGEIIDANGNTSHGSMFPKLKVLIVESCPRIELILPFLSTHDLPALKSIKIEDCDKLKYIFGQDVKLGSLKKLELDGIPNLIDIFPECNPTMSLSIKKPSSISESQEQSEPIKCNMFSWTDIYCCGKKYGHNKLRSTTITKIPLVSQDQLLDNLMESNSYPLNIWESAQCLSRQSHILCNIKKITLWKISKMKSVFILSIAPTMLLESLTIYKCNELKHIIIDMGDHDNTGGNNWGTVFPKLRLFEVEHCEKLEYIIGHFTDDHQNHTEIPLHLPALETFVLHNLPSLVSMCPKQYHTTFPQLERLVVEECPQFIGDFITHHSITRSVDGTIIKELSGNVEHFCALESLEVDHSNVESIFRVDEINERQMNLALEDIDLDVLPMMTCLFVGPNNSFSLQNLTRIKIKGCEKLKIVFTTSVIRCLPQLYYMRIEECNELKHIIEDDLENKNSSNFMSTTKTFFPKLEKVVVEKCNKLKYVFPISICKELPELNVLMIREADELEEIFVSEGDDHKVEIPNLECVVFENLPSLSHAQRIQFQAVKNRFIRNCQKLSLESTKIHDLSASYFRIDPELCRYFKTRFRQQFQKETKGNNSGNENPETSKKIAVGVEVKASSEHELTSPKKKTKQTPETEHELVENVPDLEIPTNSKELMNEQSMEQQRLLGEPDTTVKPSQLEVSTISETKNVAETCSTNSPTKNESPIQVSEISVQEGTTSSNAKRRTTSSQEYSDGEMAISSPPISMTRHFSTQDIHVNNLQETSNTDDDQVSLNDDAVIKVTSIVEEPFSKDVEFKVPESKLSLIITSPQQFRTPSMLSKGDPSQPDEELEDLDDQMDMTSFSIATTETNDEVSRNDDAFKKVSSNIEEQFPKIDDIIVVSKSKPSPWITSSVASQKPPVPSKGDPSQKVEDFSSSLLVKHFDYENLSLLTDFFVKHPSVLLNDTSLSNRYKGYAYNCLAELLKFLQTHSVLDVLGSSHSEFVELLQDVRKFGFDKEWLDDIEKRALLPGLQVSQDALQKLLDSKHILTQHVEDLKHQLASCEAVLQNITQQEAQILHTRAALSDPIGY